MSSFGRIFRVTTFGESHASGVGAVVDGCPSGLELTEQDIQPQLSRRRPGQSALTTDRDEKDQVRILSGTENGMTLGTPIALFVPNENIRPHDYNNLLSVPRPGHADFTYQKKYGIRSSSGGGRASARETIARVAAGTIAEKWLKIKFKTSIVAWVHSVGTVSMPETVINGKVTRSYSRDEIDSLGRIRILKEPKWKRLSPDQEVANALNAEYEKDFVESSDNFATAAYLANNQVYNRQGNILLKPSNLEDWYTDEIISVRCPHIPSACEMATLVRKVKHQQDSTGGIIHCIVKNVPVGLGEPCFDKLQAKLAHAMLSLPAVKGFEIGSGFAGTRLVGSQHNDPFCVDTDSGIITVSKNDAGGVLGGISSGAEIYFRVAIKPVSSIGQVQRTVDFDGNETVLHVEGRHDPCVLPRAVPLVEAMTALVLADLAMLQFARL